MAEDQPGVFLLMLSVPLVYTQACYILTPDEGVDSKEYWNFAARKFFIALAILGTLNTTLQYVYEAPDERQLGRIAAIVLIAIAAFWPNKIYRIVLVLLLTGVYMTYLF